MGDYNIDLLKDDSDRQTHDYLDLIYSHTIIPTILKPTRITETTATIIDNILTNSEREILTSILVTDISDHFPTILMTNLKKSNEANYIKSTNNDVYKRKFTNDNISNFKQRLSQTNWNDILNCIDVNDDYNKFVDKFNEIYDECIPLKKCKVNKRKVPQSP